MYTLTLALWTLIKAILSMWFVNDNCSVQFGLGYRVVHLFPIVLHWMYTITLALLKFRSPPSTGPWFPFGQSAAVHPCHLCVCHPSWTFCPPSPSSKTFIGYQLPPSQLPFQTAPIPHFFSFLTTLLASDFAWLYLCLASSVSALTFPCTVSSSF